MDIFELTIPLETNIKNANTQKMNKHDFITDITTRDVSVGNRQKSPWKKSLRKKVLKFHTKKVLWKKVLLLKSLQK